MTPVFCCGFECGQAGTVGQHWNNGASASFSTSNVRSGVRSLRINPTAASTGISTSVSFSANNNQVFRAYIYFASLPDVDIDLITCTAAGNGVRFKVSDNSFRAVIGGSVFGLG